MSKLIKVYINIIVLIFIGTTIQNNAFAMQNEYHQICVPSVQNLACHYSITEPEKKEVDLSLENTEYIKMAYMCTAVKILYGQINTDFKTKEHANKIESFADLATPKKSNTPEATNVLVPYLSYITKDLKYHKVGFVQNEDKKLVLISGNVETGAISDIYNSFLVEGIFSECGLISMQNSPQNGAFNSSHTESKLLEILKEKIKELKPKTNGIKGVIIDMFSWLDTCSDCAHGISAYQYDGIPVLFRVVSQRKYGDLVPIELSNITDNDYMHDFTFLSSNHISLVTRMDPYLDRIRDMVLEQLNLNVHRRALSADIAFWTITNPDILLHLSQCSDALYENVIDILFLRNSINGVLLKCCKLINEENDMTEQKLAEYYNKLQNFLSDDKYDEEGNYKQENIKPFLDIFSKTGFQKYGSAKQWLRAFFGNIALRLAEIKKDNVDKQQAIKYVQEYVQHRPYSPSRYKTKKTLWSHNNAMNPSIIDDPNYNNRYRNIKAELKFNSDVECE